MNSDEKARRMVERAICNAARDLSPLSSVSSVVGAYSVIVTVVVPR
jgi:hypothetical protein